MRDLRIYSKSVPSVKKPSLGHQNVALKKTVERREYANHTCAEKDLFLCEIMQLIMVIGFFCVISL